MTDSDSESDDEVAEPSAAARAIGMQLVTRFGLRLIDPHDSRLGPLRGAFELAAGVLVGGRNVLVGIATNDTGETAELVQRAFEWTSGRISERDVQRCDVLVIARTAPDQAVSRTQTAGAAVGLTVIDEQRVTANVALPTPRGLPTARDLRTVLRILNADTPAPTLAAVDLAERQRVSESTAGHRVGVLSTSTPATYAIIGICVVIEIIQQLIDWQTNGAPASCSSLSATAAQLNVGALVYSCPGGDAWWRYVSTTFVHQLSTWHMHLLFNAISLFYVGRIVEMLYGRLVMVGVFLCTAVVGNIVTILAALNGLPGAALGTIGASGGICGLLGLLVVMGTVQGKGVPPTLKNSLRQGILISAALTVFLSVAIGANNYAHLSGLAAGALIGLVVPPLHAIGGRHLAHWERGVLIAVCGACTFAMLVAVVNLLTSFGAPAA